MEKKNITKAKQEEIAKRNKLLTIGGLACAGVQLIATIVLIVMLTSLDVLPFEFKILIDILLVLFCMVTAITQRWIIPGLITKFTSLLMTAVLIAGSIYINTTDRTIDKISGSYTKIASMAVYVLADNSAETIYDLSGNTFGIISNLEREDTDKTIAMLEDEMEETLNISEYQSAVLLVDALVLGEVDAVIMNSSYLTMVTDMEEYKDYGSKVKCIMTYDIESYIVDEGDDNEELITSDDCITIYISGIDCVGPANVNRNSDVNIICTLNKKTHQVLLVSTPRDFYIPLSISNGVKDKLTHAGVYGVDVSMDTLEMLYGINIDYYVKVNFTGFVNVIDALGGIEVYSEYNFTAHHGGYTYHQGMNTVNGLQALGFARERYSFPTGDRQRGRNQMEVVKGLVNKLTSTEMLANYNSVMASISDCVVTDMPQEEITDLVKHQLEEMPVWDIKSFSVNGKGSSEYTYSLPNYATYVMIPDDELVNQAKGYLEQLHNNEIITIGE